MELSTEVINQLKEIICGILEIDADEMTDTSNFVRDHAADSLRGIEILAALERTYRIKIPQEELAKMVNFSKTLNVLGKYLN